MTQTNENATSEQDVITSEQDTTTSEQDTITSEQDTITSEQDTTTSEHHVSISRDETQITAQGKHMKSEYSKEIQLEILNEIIKNQGTDETVDVTDTVKQWNYDFLLLQGDIEQHITSSNVFAATTGYPENDGILIGETITKSGEARRLDIYERLCNERK